MLQADRDDFKNSYRNHYHTYLNSIDDNKNIYSRRLLLVYCVESGLKCVLMKKAKIYSVSKAGPDLNRLLGSHDFDILLRNIPLTSYRFPSFKTSHNDDVSANNYHEMVRYAIRTDSHEKFHDYNHQLEEIAGWLREKI